MNKKEERSLAWTNTTKPQIEKRLLKLYIKKQSLPLATVWRGSENIKTFHTGLFSTGCLYKNLHKLELFRIT